MASRTGSPSAVSTKGRTLGAGAEPAADGGGLDAVELVADADLGVLEGGRQFEDVDAGARLDALGAVDQAEVGVVAVESEPEDGVRGRRFGPGRTRQNEDQAE